MQHNANVDIHLINAYVKVVAGGGGGWGGGGEDEWPFCDVIRSAV